MVRMRDHCATCGHRFAKRKAWAYCSTFCETYRHAQRDVIVSEASMTIRERLRHAMPWDRAKVEADLAKVASAEAAIEFLTAPIVRSIDEFAEQHPELLPAMARRIKDRLRQCRSGTA